jgi:hypothetical protein
MSKCYSWSTIVLKESSYLYFSDELSCRSLHSLHLLIDGDLLVADVMVSTSMADIYMLVLILWVPLDFLNDIIIRLCHLFGIGLLLFWVQPSDR